MPRFAGKQSVHLKSKKTPSLSLARDYSPEEGAREAEVKDNTLNSQASGHFSTGSKITPDNIINLQRTLGNQAVQRMIQRQKAVGPVNKASKPVITAGSNGPVNMVLRLPKVEDIHKRGSTSSKSKNSPAYDAIFTKLGVYNGSTEQEVQQSEPGRIAVKTMLNTQLDDLVTQIDNYLAINVNKKSAKKNVASFKILKKEIELERARITIIAADNDKQYTNESKLPGWKNESWNNAIAALEHLKHKNVEASKEESDSKEDAVDKDAKPDLYNAVQNFDPNQDNVTQPVTTGANSSGPQNAAKKSAVNKVVNKLSLAKSYVETLSQQQVDLILEVDKALEAGDVAKADQALVKLKAGIPTTFPLIRSTLLRKHIGTINPKLAEAINDSKYDQQDAKMADIGHKKAGKKTSVFDYSIKTFENQKNFEATNLNMDQAVTAHQESRVDTGQFLANLKARNDWESKSKNVNLDKYKALKDYEKSAVTAYTGDYKQFNEPLRGNITPGENKGEFNNKTMAITQNLISAINKIPPYKGPVFRHDSDFPGFKEINQVGAVVTDMAFLSTTREANSLKSIVGSGKPEVLSVIKSKSGRFIKPVSFFNNLTTGDENEVLFKPGTRFKITKRVDAQHVKDDVGNLTYRWTSKLDPELKNALDQDREKPQVKIIIKKEEV